MKKMISLGIDKYYCLGRVIKILWNNGGVIILTEKEKDIILLW